MKKNKQLMADSMILFVTLSWGVSYYMMDLCLQEMGTFTLNAYRFGFAFIVAYAFLNKKMKKISKPTIIYGAILGLVLTVMYISATNAVKYTTLTNIGFLIALSVIITPILEFFVSKIMPSKKLISAILVCFIGIGLMTLNDDFTINRETLLGNILCLLTAFTCSIQVVMTGKLVRREDVKATQLGVVVLGFTGLYFLILAFLFETPQLPIAGAVWFSIIFLAVFCTGVAQVVQAIAQQYTSATHTSLIFSLEPVFAAIAAYLLAGEILSGRGYIGAALMLISILIVETNIEKIFKNNKKVI
ncbi:MAG: DMT family transporter [Peptostreptococcaceae bacterium]|nr:DMT family transporter [Peptostreptococcaceae bacterium]